MAATTSLPNEKKQRRKNLSAVLPAVDSGKVQLAAGVAADSTAKRKTCEPVNFGVRQPGGEPDMAMAGGTVAAALASVQR